MPIGEICRPALVAGSGICRSSPTAKGQQSVRKFGGFAMSISIHTNAVQMTALRSLGMAAEFTKSVESRLASGKSISTAYDDGATYAASLRIGTNVKAINAVNERLNATKDSIYRTTEAVSTMALPGLRGGGGLIMRPGRQRGRRAGLCRAGGYCGRIERSPDRRAASPGKCRGAGVARSAATTRTLPGY